MLEIVPISQKQAKRFIARHHRHNIPSNASIFNIGLEYEGELVGVAMVSVPVNRHLMDGRTVEVTRTCVKEGVKNANSMLYGACVRAAKALGWKRLITYTLPSESGISLKAAGWIQEVGTFGHKNNDWEKKHGKPQTDMFGHARIPLGNKLRWTIGESI